MNFENINLDMNERMKYYGVSGAGIALLRQGTPVAQRSWGLMEAGTDRIVNQDTLFSACSISKFATAMLVMILVKQGVLKLDENINERLVSWKLPEHSWIDQHDITLRLLLSHQAGLEDPEGSFSEFDPAYGFPLKTDLLQGITPYCQKPVTATFEPGSGFKYSDAGYCIIEQLIEDATGQSFHQLMNELLFKPLHMHSSLVSPSLPEEFKNRMASGHNKEGYPTRIAYPLYPYPAAAGLWTTPNDLALLLSEFIQALSGNSQLGLYEAMISDMLTPQGSSPWAGLGLFLDNSGRGIEITSLGWGVGFQCLLIAYPYLGTGAVIMTNTDSGVHQTQGLIGEIINSLLSQDFLLPAR